MQQKKKTIFKFLILFGALIGSFWSCSQDIGLDNPNWHQASYAEDNDLVCTAKSVVNNMQGDVSMLDMFKTTAVSPLNGKNHVASRKRTERC